MSILEIYLLTCVPGLIVAAFVRCWAHRRQLGRYERAWLIALTIGVLCSPGVYVGGNGAAVVAAVVPSLVAAIFSPAPSHKMWIIFLVSTFMTFIITFGVYVALSKLREVGDSQPS